MFYKTYNSPVGKIYLTSDGENLTALLFETSKELMKYISNKKTKRFANSNCPTQTFRFSKRLNKNPQEFYFSCGFYF